MVDVAVGRAGSVVDVAVGRARSVVDVAAGRARDRLGDGIRTFLSGSPERPRSTRSDLNDGLAGPGSAMWAVHGDVSTMVGGLRALLLQTLHPLVMAGVADHSDYRADPLGRLHRTSSFLGATTFGTADEACAAIEVVRRVHDHVNGAAPDGRYYSAHDPHLLSWVHCTEVDSFWRCRVRYGATPPAAGDADRYVAEMSQIGRRLGAEDPPLDAAGLSARLEAFRPELAVNHQARDAVRFLMWPRVPIAARAPYSAVFGAAVGMLPPFARRMLRLPMPPMADAVLPRPAAKLVLRTVRWALGVRPEVAAAAELAGA